MQYEYDLLMAATSPLGLVSDLGLDVYIKDHGAHMVNVPAVGTLWVTEHGFLSLDDNSRFIAGSCLDLLALIQGDNLGTRGLDAYRAAVELMQSLYKDKLPVTSMDAACIERVAVEARNRRLIFNAVMFPLQNGMSAPAPKIELEDKLHSLGIDAHLANRAFKVLTVDDWVRLRTRCEDAGIEAPIQNKARIVYPFFKNFYTIGTLAIVGEHYGHTQYHDIFPGKLAFSGLLSLHPGDEIYGSNDPQLANITLSAFRKAGKRATCLGVHSFKAGVEVGWKPESMKFMVKKGDSDYRKPAMLSREGVKVHMLDAVTSGAVFAGITVPWDSFIVGRILEELLDKRQITAKAKLLLESCQLSPSDRHIISLRLRAEGMLAVSDIINQMFHDGILMENNIVRIIGTSTGYKYQRQHSLDTPPEELTNFTMRLVSNTNFPADANVYHKAEITLQGQVFETVLKHDELETAKRLDKAIKASEMVANAGKQAGRVTPVISELNIARWLIPHFREVTSKLPTEEGVSELGWNGVRAMFHAPGFHVYKQNGEVKLDKVTRTRHPGVMSLNNYDFSPPAQAIVSADIPQELADIISQVCAMVGRSYHGYPVKPIPVRNTPAASKVLKRLFRSIGQVNPMELNSNQRMIQDIPGIKGFPVLATGYNRQQIKASRLPLFMLADYGATITDTHTEEEMLTAEGSIRTLLQKVSRHLLHTEGSTFKRVHSLQYENELIREGADIICRSSGVRAWPISVTPYENVERVLRSIPVGELRKYFSHDLGKQLVYMYFQRTPDKSNKQDLVMELSPLVSSLQDGGDHLVMDAGSALEILQNFYHEQVQLEPVNLPAFVVANG